MTALAVEEEKPCRCMICVSGHPFDNAYRPHTLGPDCWCLHSPNHVQIRSKCWMQGFGDLPERLRR